MGNCLGAQKLPNNIFKVRNINDDKRLVQKGYMEVTATDLLYTDCKSNEQWQWPLKFLRKYGCDGDVFSFEAGRKCPGGEGLYAFSTPKASQLFDMVARNINQGNLQPGGELSPLPSEMRPRDTLNFPQRQTSSTDAASPPPTGSSEQQVIPEQPNYQNVTGGQNGDVLVNVHAETGTSAATSSRESSEPKADSPVSATVSEPKKFQYHEVVFDKPPEDHPAPPSIVEPKSSYIRIDFSQTEKYNVERRNGTLPQFSHHSHSSINPSRTRTSIASVSSMGGEKERQRPRMNTVPTSMSKNSLSSSSCGSQNSLTESAKSPRVNGGIPHSAGGVIPEHQTYQNLVLGISGPQIPGGGPLQPNYQNVNVGCGDVSNLTSSLQQPNYENLNLTPTGVQSPNYSNITCPPRESRVPGPYPTVHGDPMAHYADLDLHRNRRTSTPKEPHQPSYMQLDFSTNSTPTPSVVSDRNPSPEAISLELPPPSVTGNRTPQPKISDDLSVNYGVLNFGAMEALTELRRQHEKDILEEKKEREKEKEKNSAHRRHTHHK